jgi:hypothetical protein
LSRFLWEVKSPTLFRKEREKRMGHPAEAKDLGEAAISTRRAGIFTVPYESKVRMPCSFDELTCPAGVLRLRETSLREISLRSG